MNPLLLTSLLSLGPSILGKLGLFGKDPQAELRKRLAQISSPENMRNQTQQFYQQFLQGPAFSQAQGTIAAGANQTGNQVAQNLAARGIGTAGVGAVVPALQSSLVGSQLGNLRAGGFQAAQNQAANSIQQQIKALLGGGTGPSQGQSLFSGGLAALSQLLPYLMQAKTPAGGGGGGAPRMGQPGFQYPVGG